MRASLRSYATALKSFSSSPSTFRILSTGTSHLPPPKTLYVLDSSFNPPTLAHLRIATSALLNDTHASAGPKRLLLLLATQNADKAPKPAAFEQRLLMMQIFASDLLSSLRSSTSTSTSPVTSPLTKDQDWDQNTEEIGVDIAVTKLPYFMDKAEAIDGSGEYGRGTPQVHLVGFDTLIRILDSKYYPPDHTLQPLVPFLEKHRLRVTYRTDDQWGAGEAQDGYLKDIKEGKRAREKARKEWVSQGRIELIEGRVGGEEVVSSTKVREAVKGGNEAALRRLVTGGVADWIMEEDLYKNE
ncbi:nicotinamide mononucleotide adenylyltransferase [Hyphodiscus hymeniophilus]|uniref:Nicotinamide mononucleotide adenylyltransferase n=1 Tax=Hyphodiscus hymeniophilus TaxID=353542 RepID=A0A9P6VE86_9HELO|nr:nicotinamide mononucleotide adenylyltransferase [Hyphodiscus hymeniophilus]